jgi:hypothetical protein
MKAGCRRFARISAISGVGKPEACRICRDATLFSISSSCMTQRRYWQALAVAGLLLASSARAEVDELNPDIDLYALMAGRCSTLKIAGRDFACRAVGYFHSERGRAHFTVALEDPMDDSHIISFSGENGRRTRENLYELRIDRMLLNSKDRPKADGLPVPMVELSAGMCRQIGNFAARQVSSISCSARDRSGRVYELQFESDGSPITLRIVRQSAPSIRQDPYR